MQSRDIKTKFAFRQIFVAEGAKQGGIIVDYHLAKLQRCTNYAIYNLCNPVPQKIKKDPTGLFYFLAEGTGFEPARR